MKCKEAYSHEKLTFYMLQAMCALDYIHQKHIYYGDMKPQNLLVFRSQHVKIGDFGISIKLDPNDENKTYSVKGLSK